MPNEIMYQTVNAHIQEWLDGGVGEDDILMISLPYSKADIVRVMNYMRFQLRLYPRVIGCAYEHEYSLRVIYTVAIKITSWGGSQSEWEPDDRF